MSTHGLHAGVSRRAITPELGTELFGYPRQRHGNEIADALNATALVLQQDETLACIVSLDWCLIDEAEVAELRAAISAATKIEPGNITLCATHTHSGPVTVTTWGWGTRDQKYLDSAREKIVQAIQEAQSTLAPVRVGVAPTQTDVGINRREVNLQGEVGLGFNEWGLRDRDLTVVRFQTESGPLASIVHLGAHPTSRGAEPSISRDWPGVMMDRVEHITGAPVVFINGAFGDVAPRTNVGGKVGDGAPAATEVGLRAATDALCAWQSIKEFREMDLQVHTSTLALPHNALPSREEAEKQVEQYADGKDARGRVRAEWEYWNSVLGAHESQPQLSRDWAQTITRLGPIAFVPFAGEIFSEIALRLKKASPFKHTLCCGTTNGSHGYYVTREARARGGYEPWVAKAYGAYILADNIDDVLVQENVKLLNSL